MLNPMHSKWGNEGSSGKKDRFTPVTNDGRPAVIWVSGQLNVVGGLGPMPSNQFQPMPTQAASTAFWLLR
jgi:hypothetical protein